MTNAPRYPILPPFAPPSPDPSARLAVPFPEGRPLPSDWHAVAILYYEVLTGRSPYPLVQERWPAWSDLRIVDDRPEGTEHGARWIAQPPPPASSIDASVTPDEDALAHDLLALAIDGPDELLARVARVVAGIERPSSR